MSLIIRKFNGKKNKISASLVRGEKTSTSTSAIMHSTKPDNIHGSPFLFTLMDNALWLLGREPELQTIEIVLHPVDGFHTPQTIFQSLRRRFFSLPSSILGAVKRRLGRVNQRNPILLIRRQV